MKIRSSMSCLMCVAAVLAAAIAPDAFAQATSAPATTPAAPPDKPPLKQEELEQLLAPIALYPDSLLTQMLMASTYPLEIVQADRWTTARKDLSGDALAKSLEEQTWDPSVKSMVNFPTVLRTMSEKIDLTVKLGDAFIGQQADVLKTVQHLRAKAKAEGNLKSNEQQTVGTEPPPEDASQTTPPAQIITIESTKTEVVYVPVYSPSVVYGSWPYPTYPPYPYYPPYPPGYVASRAIVFGTGVACGVAWGYAWGHCGWGHHDINIDVNRNVNFNTNINRSKYQANINRGGGSWQHDPAHRQGVPYRTPATAQKFGSAHQSAQAASARSAYRGRDQGHGENRAGTGAGTGRPAAATPPRSPATTPKQTRTPSDRASHGGGVFEGAGSSGGAVHSASERGQHSRNRTGNSGSSRGGGGGGGRR